ncbi:phosphotriesterase family protein [Georgenia wangjunii]|uniref:phosphotriesterase family protein n=1 Tax=Georgenia wangjunii TaxID=3117730 RepID=UPI002F26BDF4
MTIQTVDGPLSPEEVDGVVLPHEHLAIDLRTETDRAGVLDHPDLVSTELAAAREHEGLALVVDQTCRGMGRDVGALRTIAQRSGVAVVASTGWYYERFHPEREPGDDVGAATELLVADLTVGLDGTDALAGVIGEVGTHGDEPSTAERVSLLAAGRAAVATGRPVSTHAHLGRGALAQLDLLLGTGVEPQRISIGHQDLTDATAQHVALAEAGAYVAFDTAGKDSYQPDGVRLRLVLALLERGLGRHVLLSNDISRHGYLTAHGGQGFRHVLGPFAARLRAAGVDETTLGDLYRANALRWLSGRDHVGTPPTGGATHTKGLTA